MTYTPAPCTIFPGRDASRDVSRRSLNANQLRDDAAGIDDTGRAVRFYACSAAADRINGIPHGEAYNRSAGACLLWHRGEFI